MVFLSLHQDFFPLCCLGLRLAGQLLSTGTLVGAGNLQTAELRLKVAGGLRAQKYHPVQGTERHRSKTPWDPEGPEGWVGWGWGRMTEVAVASFVLVVRSLVKKVHFKVSVQHKVLAIGE